MYYTRLAEAGDLNALDGAWDVETEHFAKLAALLAHVIDNVCRRGAE